MAKGQHKGNGPGKSIEDAANALKKAPQLEEAVKPEVAEAKPEEPAEEKKPEAQEETVKPEQPEGEKPVVVELEVKPESEVKPEEPVKPEEVQPESKNIPFVPVPNEEQIEMSAQHMVENPDLFDACQRTVDRARAIIAERNAEPKLTVEQMEQKNYDRLVATYGKDFVTAKKGTNQGYFSRKSWNAMGKNKRGWAEVTKEMPEVAAKLEGDNTEK